MATQEHYNIINKFVHEIEEFFNKYSSDNQLEQIKIIKEKLSLEHAFIRLFLDYDYQVCNGGHQQYVDNGYHSTEQYGCMDNVSENSDIHEELVNLSKLFFEKYPIKLAEDFLKIIGDFKISTDKESETEENCYECDGHGYIFENIEEEEEEKECEECNGDGYVMVDNQNHGNIDHSTEILFRELDHRYFQINENLIAGIAISIKNKKITEAFKIF